MAKRISAIFFLTVIFSVFAVLCVRFATGEASNLTLTLRALVDGKISAQLPMKTCLPIRCCTSWQRMFACLGAQQK